MRNIGIYIVIGVVILGLIAIGFYYYGKKSQKGGAAGKPLPAEKENKK